MRAILKKKPAFSSRSRRSSLHVRFEAGLGVDRCRISSIELDTGLLRRYPEDGGGRANDENSPITNLRKIVEIAFAVLDVQSAWWDGLVGWPGGTA